MHSRRIDTMHALAIREAAAKYDIPVSTLRGWVNDGMVRIVHRAAKPGMPTYIAEADVAKLAHHYRPGGGRGRRARLKEHVLTA